MAVGAAVPGTVVPSGAYASPGGAQGLQGVTGVRGATWWNGAGPPTPPPAGSLPGDYYLDTSTGDVWQL